MQLLDPKWREEQKRFQDKQKETGFAEGSSIADSLRTFAKKRGDIFGQSVAATSENSAQAIARESEILESKVKVSTTLYIIVPVKYMYMSILLGTSICYDQLISDR